MIRLLPILLIGGCGRPDLTPAWAYDPITLTAVDGDPEAAIGFQSWQLYGPGWAKKYKDRHYVCVVLVELEATVLADCDAPACQIGWDTEATVVETDCADPALAENPLFTSLHRLALGAPYVAEDAAWPGGTTLSHAAYSAGSDWQVHGTAYPEVLDQGGAAAPEWTGVEPFLFVPDAAFPL
jgi:hypothetical protein